MISLNPFKKHDSLPNITRVYSYLSFKLCIMIAFWSVKVQTSHRQIFLPILVPIPLFQLINYNISADHYCLIDRIIEFVTSCSWYKNHVIWFVIKLLSKLNRTLLSVSRSTFFWCKSLQPLCRAPVYNVCGCWYIFIPQFFGRCLPLTMHLTMFMIVLFLLSALVLWTIPLLSQNLANSGDTYFPPSYLLRVLCLWPLCFNYWLEFLEHFKQVNFLLY